MDFASAWAGFDVRIGIFIFFVYIVIDGLYAYYTLEVTKRNPYSAATAGALMYFLLAIGVLNYVHDFLYVVPLALGSWVGTFIMVKREQNNHITPKSSS